MPSNPVDQVLFSARQLWVAAILTNPVATALLLAVNASTSAREMLLDLLFFGIVAVAQLAFVHFVPGTGGMMLSWIPVVFLSIAWIDLRHSDSLVLHEHLNGAQRSWWGVLLAWVLSIPVLMVLSGIVEVVLG